MVKRGKFDGVGVVAYKGPKIVIYFPNNSQDHNWPALQGQWSERQIARRKARETQEERKRLGDVFYDVLNRAQIGYQRGSINFGIVEDVSDRQLAGRQRKYWCPVYDSATDRYCDAPASVGCAHRAPAAPMSTEVDEKDVYVSLTHRLDRELRATLLNFNVKL